MYKRQGKALYRPVRSLATYSFDSSSDEEVEEAVHVHFDGDGRGPYGRADIDIIIVADSVEEARPIVEATIAKVVKRYKNHRIYETPCSVQTVDAILPGASPLFLKRFLGASPHLPSVPVSGSLETSLSGMCKSLQC